MQKALAEHSLVAVWFKHSALTTAEPAAHPRFHEVLRRIGFPP